MKPEEVRSNGAGVTITFTASMADLAMLSPQQSHAIMRGVAECLNADRSKREIKEE